MKKILLNEIFKVLTAALVIFLIMEAIWPGIVIAYINLNLVLIFWLMNSIILLAFNEE